MARTPKAFFPESPDSPLPYSPVGGFPALNRRNWGFEVLGGFWLLAAAVIALGAGAWAGVWSRSLLLAACCLWLVAFAFFPVERWERRGGAGGVVGARGAPGLCLCLLPWPPALGLPSPLRAAHSPQERFFIPGCPPGVGQ